MALACMALAGCAAGVPKVVVKLGEGDTTAADSLRPQVNVAPGGDIPTDIAPAAGLDEDVIGPGGVTQTMRTMGIVVGVGLLSRFFAANQGLGFGRDLGRTFLAAAAVTGVGAAISGLRAWGPGARRAPEPRPV